jgi:hypothetical protein
MSGKMNAKLYKKAGILRFLTGIPRFLTGILAREYSVDH